MQERRPPPYTARMQIYMVGGACATGFWAAR